MEYRDLYDENKNLLGSKVKKDEIIPEGTFYLMVVIMVQNSENKFLIQKRTANKGGTWAFTGGHPKSGESSLDGIITEVSEEIGIDISNDEIILFKEAKGKNSFCDLYYLKKDISIDDIKIQAEEVDSVKWASLDEIHQFISNKEFNKGHAMMFADCLTYLERN